MHIRTLPWKLQTLVSRLLTGKSWTLSQAGQDHWVFGEVFNEQQRGYFLDIGAHDGVTISNTYLLERRYNWSGLCVEANPITFELLSKNRRAECLNICLDSEAGEVDFALRDVLGGIVDSTLDNNRSPAAGSVVKIKTLPLMDVLNTHAAPRVIDYLSIDIEGAEERVLGSFDFGHYRFNCITIERPPARLRELFKRHGYILVKEIPDLDCFYIHEGFLGEYKKNLFEFHEKKHLAVQWW